MDIFVSPVAAMKSGLKGNTNTDASTNSSVVSPVAATKSGLKERFF